MGLVGRGTNLYWDYPDGQMQLPGFECLHPKCAGVTCGPALLSHITQLQRATPAPREVLLASALPQQEWLSPSTRLHNHQPLSHLLRSFSDLLTRHVCQLMCNQHRVKEKSFLQSSEIGCGRGRNPHALSFLKIHEENHTASRILLLSESLGYLQIPAIPGMKTSGSRKPSKKSWTSPRR